MQAMTHEVFQYIKNHISPITRKILQTPFARELMAGTLPREGFNRFLSSDIHFLRVYIRAISLHLRTTRYPIKLPLSHLLQVAEREKAYITRTVDKKSIALLPPEPWMKYLNHLELTSQNSLGALFFASLCPCSIVFKHIYSAIRPQANHPYQDWASGNSAISVETRSLGVILQTIAPSVPITLLSRSAEISALFEYSIFTCPYTNKLLQENNNDHSTKAFGQFRPH